MKKRDTGACIYIIPPSNYLTNNLQSQEFKFYYSGSKYAIIAIRKINALKYFSEDDDGDMNSRHFSSYC